MVIDYIQLLQGSQRKASESRVQEVTEITTGLKALAKELNVPIVALSQLSRQVENRDDKRPQLSDLRESGSIEQDADVVLFVFREEYYLSNKEPRPGTEEHLKWQTEMAWCTARPRSSSASSATARPAPCNCSSTPRSRASAISARRSFAGADRRLALQPYHRIPRLDGAPAVSQRRSGYWIAESRRPLRRLRGVHIPGHGPPVASPVPVTRPTQPRPPARARGRRHADHRSRRHRRQLQDAARARDAERMRRRGQGRRLWLRHRPGHRGADARRLPDILRRASGRGAARARHRAARPSIYVLNGFSARGRPGLRRDPGAAGDQQPGRARRMGPFRLDQRLYRRARRCTSTPA